MNEYFETLDLIKILISFAVGVILGFERELKDKAAGLKTITIICLSSTLFTLISYKFSGEGDPTRIASYVVSGIGFLGAGVIFKEGFTIHGLTTAGVIWISAALGMGIGFGAFYLTATVLAAALLIIYSSRLLTKSTSLQYSQKNITIDLKAEDKNHRESIIGSIRNFSNNVEVIGLEKKDNTVRINLNVHIASENLKQLQNYLLEEPLIESFEV